MITDYIEKLSFVQRYDAKLYGIIGEEISAYIGRAKNSEETVNLIQNRVQTYVNEQ